ncbi:hypothetical protein ACED34_08545, partial [Vibrio splendidus]|uniref:hypothetical protein n=1 Tax=Vibrio splendidus TaxID=29497 RepID=UPI00352E7300
ASHIWRRWSLNRFDQQRLSKSLSKILPTHSLDKKTSDQIVVPKEKVAAAKNQTLDNSNNI